MEVKNKFEICGLFYCSYIKLFIFYAVLFFLNIKNSTGQTTYNLHNTQKIEIINKIETFLINAENRLSEDSSIFFSNQALTLAKEYQLPVFIAKSYNLIGKRLKKQGNFYNAEVAFFKALEICEKNNLQEQKSYSKQNIGDIYNIANKPSEALVYYKEALEISEKIKYKNGILLNLNNIGIAFLRLKDFKNSIFYHQKCLLKSQAFKNSKYVSFSNHNLGLVYKNLNNHKLAIEYIQNAVAGYEKEKDYESYALACADLSDVYYHNMDFANSMKFAKVALNFNSNSLNTTFVNSYANLAKIHSINGDFKNAYNSLISSQKLSDSLIRIEKNQVLESAKFGYELNKSKEENIKKEEKNEMLLIFVSISFLFIALILYNNRLLNKKNKLINNQSKQIESLNFNLEEKIIARTKELEIANKELVLKNFEITEALFKGQSTERKRVAAELHDNLGSTLSALKWRLGALDAEALSPKEKEIYDGIKAMMGTAYEEVRHISHNLFPAEFGKYGLVGAIKKLINEINENGKISFDLVSVGSFELLDKKLSLELYSIAMELINNCLKHSKANKGKIEIVLDDNGIYLQILDNGIGNHEIRKYGNGLRNIEERVNHLAGKIILNSGKLEDEFTGLSVSILIEFKSENSYKNL